MSTSILHLAKQNFKFSSAHFLIFDEVSAEMLHGHNYQVEVDFYCKSEAISSDKGYVVDFNELKSVIKALCDIWDEHILLPELHPDMKFKKSLDTKNYEINFRDRFYSFPISETIWLPVQNTSVENLSALLAREIALKTKNLALDKIQVKVEETRGQSASYILTC